MKALEKLVTKEFLTETVKKAVNRVTLAIKVEAKKLNKWMRNIDKKITVYQRELLKTDKALIEKIKEHEERIEQLELGRRLEKKKWTN